MKLTAYVLDRDQLVEDSAPSEVELVESLSQLRRNDWQAAATVNLIFGGRLRDRPEFRQVLSIARRFDKRRSEARRRDEKDGEADPVVQPVPQGGALLLFPARHHR